MPMSKKVAALKRDKKLAELAFDQLVESMRLMIESGDSVVRSLQKDGLGKLDSSVIMKVSRLQSAVMQAQHVLEKK